MGVVFYEMLTGELPLGRFDPPSERSTVDRQWDQVVLRALEKEPRNRYQNASEVKTEVEKVSEQKPPVAGRPIAQAASPVEMAGAAPHYGFLSMGGVMIGLGLPVLAIALLVPTHVVFAWIGMGIALGGGGCCAIAFMEDAWLPAGSRVNYSMLILGGVLNLVGLALLLSIPIAGGWPSFDPSNVFVWVGGGLMLGGGGCWAIAWEAGRPADDAKEPLSEKKSNMS